MGLAARTAGKRGLLGFMLVLVLLHGEMQVRAQNPPLRLAVLPFEVRFMFPSLSADTLSSSITDIVEETFFNTGHYRLIDRRTLLQVVREQGIGMMELADPKTAAQIGRILGVQVLIIGTINVYEVQYLGDVFGSRLYRAIVRLTARAVVVETSEVLGIARSAGEARGFYPPTRIGQKSVGEIATESAVKELVGKLDALLQQGK